MAELGHQLVWMGWCPFGLVMTLLSPFAPENPEDSIQNMIVEYHPVSIPSCLCKQEVGKPSQNASQLCAKYQRCVNDDLRVDGLRKVWGFRFGTWNVHSLTEQVNW